MFSSSIVDLISKVSPFLGTALGGPYGAIIGSLISKILGDVDLNNHEQVVHVLSNPDAQIKLKELEMQLNDLQNARTEYGRETGLYKLVRPLLAVVSMLAILVDLYAIHHIDNQTVVQVLIVMLIVLVWDVRQIYKFYFGSGEELPQLPFLNKKK